jgi:hypothetical protein
MPEQLMVKPYSYGSEKNKEPYGVVDADGAPIHEKDFVEVAQHDHPWLTEGEIVQVVSAKYSGQRDMASLYITTSKGSSTGIHSNKVRVAEGELVGACFELAYIEAQLARVEHAVASLKLERTGLREQRKRRFRDLAREKRREAEGWEETVKI